MKKIIFLILVAVILTNCKKDNNNDNTNGNESSIVIKGRISAKKNKSGNSLSDAKMVLVINVHIGKLSSHFVNIVDGSFSYNSQMGIATALVFLDDQYNSIGTLSSQGLNLLPLCNLTNGDNTTIDLSYLSLVGNSVIPSHDPLGNEIIITEAEINSLKVISGFFENIAKNIDTDNDSVLDVLNNKQLFIKTRFNFSGGQWGINNLAPVFSDSLLGYQLQIDGAQGFSHPSSVVLSGPSASPYSNINLICNNPDGNGGFYAVFGRQPFLPFKSGTYTINIDGKNHTMDYTFIDPELNLLFILPTLHTNSDGKLVSISLEYKLPDSTSINPVNILTDVMVQFTNTSGVQFYDTPRLINENATIEGCDCVKGLFSYTLNTPLDISALKTLSVGYNDLLGNLYAISWHQ
ncbi:MAG: hypothetical protein Q7U54_13780 [Bacteroidales bacterium]|nr:hypothetical protein [Bacteroidales bacterium]